MLTPNARLHLRVLVELAQRDLRDRVALQLDHQAHAGAIRLVAQVGDLGDLLVADEVGDLRDQPAVAALLDRERELGDDDRLLAALDRLDVGLGADPDRAAARPVGVLDARRAHDRAAAREVRALDVLHQTRRCRSPDPRCRRWTAPITSPRLCGGMFVAIPTAIPDEPLTSRFGNRDGSTSGSLEDSS